MLALISEVLFLLPRMPAAAWGITEQSGVIPVFPQKKSKKTKLNISKNKTS